MKDAGISAKTGNYRPEFERLNEDKETIKILTENNKSLELHITLKQKKKMILSYNTHYHLFFSYHCSEQNTTSFAFSLKAAIKKSP